MFKSYETNYNAKYVKEVLDELPTHNFKLKYSLLECFKELKEVEEFEGIVGNQKFEAKIMPMLGVFGPWTQACTLEKHGWRDATAIETANFLVQNQEVMLSRLMMGVPEAYGNTNLCATGTVIKKDGSSYLMFFIPFEQEGKIKYCVKTMTVALSVMGGFPEGYAYLIVKDSLAKGSRE